MTRDPGIVPYRRPVDARASGLEAVQAAGGAHGRLAPAEMRRGGGVVMPGSVDAPPGVGSPGLHLVVEDVVAHHARAMAAGAQEVHGPEWSFGPCAPSTEPPSWA